MSAAGESSNATRSPSARSPSLWWPTAGAALGLGIAALGLLTRSEPQPYLPDSAAARVNDVFISAESYRRTLERLESMRGQALSADDRERTLQQLIEEELLVQRGTDLGLVSSEATVRAAIVQSLVASVTAEADAANPSDVELERHLTETPPTTPTRRPSAWTHGRATTNGRHRILPVACVVLDLPRCSYPTVYARCRASTMPRCPSNVYACS